MNLQPNRPLISVRDCVKTYDLGEMQVRALRGVTLDVDAGEFVALTGPSGSGKSTFMHLLGCLDRPTSGQYFLDGQDVVGAAPSARCRACATREIGFVFQGFNLLPRTTALENVELPLLYARQCATRRSGASARPRRCGGRPRRRLGHHPNQLSGGQQQRVAIARALVNNPKLLLADEPTGNLDTRTSIEVMGIFQRLNEERGLTIVLVTHEPDIAEYGTRIVAFPRRPRADAMQPVHDAARVRADRDSRKLDRGRANAAADDCVGVHVFLMTVRRRRQGAAAQRDAHRAHRARDDHRRRRRDRHGRDRHRRAHVDREPDPQRRLEHRDGQRRLRRLRAGAPGRRAR